MGRVKGTGVRAVYNFLEQRHGPEGMAKLKDALSAENRLIMEKPILPITWIDFGYYMRMIVTADKVLGQGDFKLVEAAARYNMNVNFRGVYKILISFVDPVFVINRANMAWRQWFDSGKLVTEWQGERHAHFKLVGFEDIPLHHEHNLTPSMDEIIHISGAKKTETTHIACVLKGDQDCVWDLKWEM